MWITISVSFSLVILLPGLWYGSCWLIAGTHFLEPSFLLLLGIVLGLFMFHVLFTSQIIATQPPKINKSVTKLAFFNLIYFLSVYFNVFIVISHF